MNQISLDLKVEKSFVAVDKDGNALFTGTQAQVNTAAAAYAAQNKLSVRVMSAEVFAKLPAETLLKQHRAHVRELNTAFSVQLQEAGSKAANRMAKIMAKPDYVVSSASLQAAIQTLVNAGTYKRSDVLSKAVADMPLSKKQIAWLLCEAARVNAIEKASKKFAPALQAAIEVPF